MIVEARETVWVEGIHAFPNRPLPTGRKATFYVRADLFAELIGAAKEAHGNMAPQADHARWKLNNAILKAEEVLGGKAEPA